MSVQACGSVINVEPCQGRRFSVNQGTPAMHGPSKKENLAKTHFLVVTWQMPDPCMIPGAVRTTGPIDDAGGDG